MTTAAELLSHLTRQGFRLEVRGEALRVSPKEALTNDLRQSIKALKPALLALLEPARSPETEGYPKHWEHIPELPAKGAWAIMGTPETPARYRVCLFGRWYLLRFEPTISETTVSLVDSQTKRRMFADISEFYRWAWAEAYAAELTFRETN